MGRVGRNRRKDACCYYVCVGCYILLVKRSLLFAALVVFRGPDTLLAG